MSVQTRINNINKQIEQQCENLYNIDKMETLDYRLNQSSEILEEIARLNEELERLNNIPPVKIGEYVERYGATVSSFTDDQHAILTTDEKIWGDTGECLVSYSELRKIVDTTK